LHSTRALKYFQPYQNSPQSFAALPKKYKYIIVIIGIALVLILLVYLLYERKIEAMGQMILKQPPRMQFALPDLSSQI